MSFLFLNGRTLKGLRITLRLLGDTVPYNPLGTNQKLINKILLKVNHNKFKVEINFYLLFFELMFYNCTRI
jgi:hypothetical protein